jgi:peptidoglycan hydrolase-like protein with peptidoglycan-binding domain
MHVTFIDHLPRRLTRPMLFFPALALLALLGVYGFIEAGLALTGRWERDLMRRMDYYRAHEPQVLVVRYEERLRAVRAALTKRGYHAGPADAAMGPRTAEALRSFQRRHGLPMTGRPDPATLTALGIEP